MSNRVFLERFHKVIDASELSDVSKKTYKDRQTRLTKLMDHDLDWVMLHPNETCEKIKQFEIQTQKGYINSILTLFKYTKNMKEKHKKLYNKWTEIFEEVYKKAEEKYMNIEMSERQKQAYVKWADVIKVRDGLDKKSDAYLMLSMYTMIPPSRADMNMLKIYHMTEIENSKYPNYIVIYEDNIKLVYNEFKSKSNRLQKYEKVLPKRLEDVIRYSLRFKPRNFLIVSPRTGKPYDKATSFAAYFARILSKIFDKPVTINTLRHSFVNSLDMNKLTPLEKELIAKDLMHTVATMDKYRYSIIGNDRVCEISCDEKKE